MKNPSFGRNIFAFFFSNHLKQSSQIKESGKVKCPDNFTTVDFLLKIKWAAPDRFILGMFAVFLGDDISESVTIRDYFISQFLRIPSLTNQDFMVHVTGGFWSLLSLDPFNKSSLRKNHVVVPERNAWDFSMPTYPGVRARVSPHLVGFHTLKERVDVRVESTKMFGWPDLL